MEKHQLFSREDSWCFLWCEFVRDNDIIKMCFAGGG